MKKLQLKLVFTLLFVSVFLLACVEIIPRQDAPAPTEKYGKYQQAKQDYETAKSDYESAKKDYESATKSNNDVEITSSENLQQKKNLNKQTKNYTESSLLVSIYADAKVNADAYGRATPVSIHIFQLDEADTFDSLDYYTLVETDDPSRIDRTFINKQVLEFFPDEKRKVFLNIDKEAHYLGFLATYSDTSATRWKAIIPLQSTRNIVNVILSEDGIQVSQ